MTLQAQLAAAEDFNEMEWSTGQVQDAMDEAGIDFVTQCLVWKSLAEQEGWKVKPVPSDGSRK